MPDPRAGCRIEQTDTTPGPWEAYFTVHGDPMVVPSAMPYPTSRIADVSTAPTDYGRANAILIAQAPTLAAIAARVLTGWTDIASRKKWRRYVGVPIGNNSVDHVEQWDEMTDAEHDLIVSIRANASGHFDAPTPTPSVPLRP